MNILKLIIFRDKYLKINNIFRLLFRDKYLKINNIFK